MTAVVSVQGLTHRYGDRVALDDLQLEILPHEIFGLLGPNGGGKTTLFRILSTLMRPTTGHVRVFGLDVVAERNAVRRRIGVAFQAPSLDKKLTVRENLTHHGHIFGLSGPPLRQRIEALLRRFEIAERADERAENLSGGLRRRVEIARSLLHQPELLLLDEPGSGLDPHARREVAACLAELRQRDGVTVLLTTHIMEEAEHCDRLALLDRGRLVALDTPSALKERIGGDVIRLQTRTPATLRDQIENKLGIRAAVINGEVRIERARGHELVPQLVEAFPGEIESVTIGKPTLEDAFIHLTGHRLDQAE